MPCTLTLTIPTDQIHQALALKSGKQAEVIVPFPHGFGYRDALRFTSLSMLSSTTLIIRRIKAVTTITRSINHKLTPCAVFILGDQHA